jgi:hypothetical protein
MNIVINVLMYSESINMDSYWYNRQSKFYGFVREEKNPSIVLSIFLCYYRPVPVNSVQTNPEYSSCWIPWLHWGHMFLIVIPLRNYKLRGRLHGALSTPVLKLALLTGLNFVLITWTISTPACYTFSALITGSKKASILFSCNK